MEQEGSDNKSVLSAGALPSELCNHPPIISGHYFGISVKKVIIGYNLSFEPIVLILDCKKTCAPFIELSSFNYGNFYLQAEKIYESIRKNEKASFNLGSNLHIKTTSKNNKSTVCFEDSARSSKILFSEKEFTFFLHHRHCFSYIVTKLISNKANAQILFSNYANICNVNNTEALELFQMPNLMPTSNVDFIPLFYQIPLQMKPQLEFEIALQSNFNSIN